MLANGQRFPSLNSYAPGIETDDDGGITVYIGPEPPEGKERTGSARSPTPAGSRSFDSTGRLNRESTGNWKPDDLEPT